MSGNELLLKTLHKSQHKLQQGLLSRYQSDYDENEFFLYHLKNRNKAILFSGILNIFYKLGNSYFIYIDGTIQPPIYSLLVILLSLFDLFIIIIIYCESKRNWKSLYLPYIKIFITIIYFYYFLFVLIHVKNEVDYRLLAICRNFYLMIIIVLVEFSCSIVPTKMLYYPMWSLFTMIILFGLIRSRKFSDLGPEILFCLVGFGFFYLINDSILNKRELYESMKDNETIRKFYENFINNMEFQYLSMFTCSDYDELDDNNINVNKNKIIRHNDNNNVIELVVDKESDEKLLINYNRSFKEKLFNYIDEAELNTNRKKSSTNNSNSNSLSNNENDHQHKMFDYSQQYLGSLVLEDESNIDFYKLLKLNHSDKVFLFYPKHDAYYKAYNVTNNLIEDKEILDIKNYDKFFVHNLNENLIIEKFLLNNDLCNYIRGNDNNTTNNNTINKESFTLLNLITTIKKYFKHYLKSISKDNSYFDDSNKNDTDTKKENDYKQGINNNFNHNNHKTDSSNRLNLLINNNKSYIEIDNIKSIKDFEGNKLNEKNKEINISDINNKTQNPLISLPEVNTIKNNSHLVNNTNNINSNCNHIYSHNSTPLSRTHYTFITLGTFSNSSKTKFFKASYRVFFINQSSFLIDMVIDEITEIKKAEKISSETIIKNKLFSKLAHEFKTPLIIIKNMVTDIALKLQNIPFYFKSSNYNTNKNTILSTMLSELKEDSCNISYLSEYVHFLINDIILYSNETSVKINNENNIDLKEILDFSFGSLEALLSSLPGNKTNIIPEIVFDEEIMMYSFSSDKSRLKQVLLNLISNSVKFTKHGKISIKALLNKEKNCIELSVCDTGIGISGNELNEMNTCVENNSTIRINVKNKYNEMGTGIGVGIVKMILNKLNHELVIKSEIGMGSEFIIIIKDIKKYDDEIRRIKEIKELNEENESESNEYSSYSSNDIRNNSENYKGVYSKNRDSHNYDDYNYNDKSFVDSDIKIKNGKHKYIKHLSIDSNSSKININSDSIDYSNNSLSIYLNQNKDIKDTIKKESKKRSRKYNNCKKLGLFSIKSNSIKNNTEKAITTKKISNAKSLTYGNKSIFKELLYNNYNNKIDKKPSNNNNFKDNMSININIFQSPIKNSNFYTKNKNTDHDNNDNSNEFFEDMQSPKVKSFNSTSKIRFVNQIFKNFNESKSNNKINSQSSFMVHKKNYSSCCKFINNSKINENINYSETDNTVVLFKNKKINDDSNAYEILDFRKDCYLSNDDSSNISCYLTDQNLDINNLKNSNDKPIITLNSSLNTIINNEFNTNIDDYSTILKRKNDSYNNIIENNYFNGSCNSDNLNKKNKKAKFSNSQTKINKINKDESIKDNINKTTDDINKTSKNTNINSSCNYNSNIYKKKNNTTAFKLNTNHYSYNFLNLIKNQIPKNLILNKNNIFRKLSTSIMFNKDSFYNSKKKNISDYSIVKLTKDKLSSFNKYNNNNIDYRNNKIKVTKNHECFIDKKKQDMKKDLYSNISNEENTNIMNKFFPFSIIKDGNIKRKHRGINKRKENKNKDILNIFNKYNK